MCNLQVLVATFLLVATFCQSLMCWYLQAAFVAYVEHSLSHACTRIDSPGWWYEDTEFFAPPPLPGFPALLRSSIAIFEDPDTDEHRRLAVERIRAQQAADSRITVENLIEQAPKPECITRAQRQKPHHPVQP